MSGMDDNEDEHNFSDDEFDTLPLNALVELEQEALRSTQHQQPVAQVRKLLSNQPHVANDARPILQSKPQQTTKPAPVQYQQQPRSYANYGQSGTLGLDENTFEDDGVATPVEEKATFIPQKIPSEMTQREQWRQDRFSKAPAKGIYKAPQILKQPAARNSQRTVQADSGHLDKSYDGGLQDSMLLDEQPRDLVATRTVEEEALRAQIDGLLRDRDEMMTKLHSANNTVLNQRGEISIIRENQRKESTTFDRQLAALKKTAQDEAAKHKAILDAMNEESKKLATHNQFLKHELDQESSRSKMLQKSLKERQIIEKTDSTLISPFKAPAHSLRDGFDDDELMVLSPSKSGRRSKGGTPTAGNKRKRKIDMQSPIPPLVLRQSSAPEPAPAEDSKPPAKAERVVPIVRADRTAQKNLQLVQRILNHRVDGEKQHLVESFVKFAFPYEPVKTFTSIVIEGTAQLSGKRLPAQALKIFIDIWTRALKEKYYKCIPSLLDVANFIINLEPSVIDAETIIDLLPVLQASGKVNGTIRFNHSPVSQANFGKFKQTPQSELNTDIDASECLETIYNIASICLTDDKKIDLFWRSMEMDFILLMLNSSQPISEITTILHLLVTSILPNTFAMISDNEEEQSKMEGYVIDRVCWLLWETPRVDEGLPQPSETEICSLRIEAMALLQTLAISSAPHPHTSPTHHGSLILARHRNAIARLVRCLYDELELLYHDPPPQLRTQHTSLINSAVKLLYHLLQTHPDTINMQTKLLAINGCVHRYRVVLTRLAFGEESVWHEGVEDSTVEMAFEMLEEVVTPEEAEALVAAFPGWNGRKNKGASQS